MKTIEVTIVRIYITEASHLLTQLVDYLKDSAKVRGVTVLRAISGYGDDKVMHTSGLVDLSLDLPLVIEFFDEPIKVATVLEHLNTTLKPEHIVFWNAKANV